MNHLPFLLSVPWTIERYVRHDDGDYFVLRVVELPGFVVASSDESELDRLFWEALEDHLASYLEDGELPPLPQETRAALKTIKTLDFKVQESASAALGRRSSFSRPAHQLEGRALTAQCANCGT